MSVSISPDDPRATPDSTLGLILAGGRGTRLGGLTQHCAKPIVHFGGKFRCIDFSLSNCWHSGIHRIGVLTQYKARKLDEHLQLAWNLSSPSSKAFVSSWPASPEPDSVYRGTADAIRRNVNRIRQISPRHVLILAADHIYKMDYRQLLATHVAHRADMTIGAVEIPLEKAGQFGVLTADDDGCVVRFQEKPSSPVPLGVNPDRVLASMGIYLFNTDVLLDCLEEEVEQDATAHDFGKDIIPALIRDRRIVAHHLKNRDGATGYWRDIGTLDALWSANMDLIERGSGLSLDDPSWPILTREPQNPPALWRTGADGESAVVTDALVSNGCVVTGAAVRRSVLSYDIHVDRNSVVKDSVILPHVRIGRGCQIQHAIVDQHCVIPDGFTVGCDAKIDAVRFEISGSGVVLVTPANLQRAIGVPELVSGAPEAVSAIPPINPTCNRHDGVKRREKNCETAASAVSGHSA